MQLCGRAWQERQEAAGDDRKAVDLLGQRGAETGGGRLPILRREIGKQRFCIRPWCAFCKPPVRLADECENIGEADMELVGIERFSHLRRKAGSLLHERAVRHGRNDPVERRGQKRKHPVGEISELSCKFSRPCGFQTLGREVAIVCRAYMPEQVISQGVRRCVGLDDAFRIDAVAGRLADLLASTVT